MHYTNSKEGQHMHIQEKETHRHTLTCIAFLRKLLVMKTQLLVMILEQRIYISNNILYQDVTS